MPRGSVLPTLALLLATIAPGARADEVDNWKRLEDMPRERRVHLSTTLDRFDTLPSDEKAAVRELDASLAKLDHVKQARYQVLLRRYHVWIQHLNDDQKKQLAAADSIGARLKLVEAWRKAEKEANSRARANLVFGVHPGDLGAFPPFEMANLLRVWFTLDEKEKVRVAAITPISGQISELNAIARKNHIPMPRFPVASEDALIARIEKEQDRVKGVFAYYSNRREQQQKAYEKELADYEKWLKEKEKARPKEFEKPRERPKPPKGPLANAPLHHLAESLYFIDNPPAYVSEANLVRFEAQMPTWLRASLDPLPPEDARRRLKILYRQIYPVHEIPPPAPKAEAAKPKEPRIPAAPKSGGPTVPL